jgi:redox-sensitive bicupin YhaK (pirin superfamily)
VVERTVHRTRGTSTSPRPPGARYAQPLAATTHNAIAYVYRGALSIGGTEVPRRGGMANLANDAGVSDGVVLRGRHRWRAVAILIARPAR